MFTELLVAQPTQEQKDKLVELKVALMADDTSTAEEQAAKAETLMALLSEGTTTGLQMDQYDETDHDSLMDLIDDIQTALNPETPSEENPDMGDHKPGTVKRLNGRLYYQPTNPQSPAYEVQEAEVQNRGRETEVTMKVIKRKTGQFAWVRPKAGSENFLIQAMVIGETDDDGTARIIRTTKDLWIHENLPKKQEEMEDEQKAADATYQRQDTLMTLLMKKLPDSGGYLKAMATCQVPGITTSERPLHGGGTIEIIDSSRIDFDVNIPSLEWCEATDWIDAEESYKEERKAQRSTASQIKINHADNMSKVNAQLALASKLGKVQISSTIDQLNLIDAQLTKLPENSSARKYLVARKAALTQSMDNVTDVTHQLEQ